MSMQKYLIFLALSFLSSVPQTEALSCDAACHSPRSSKCTIVVQDFLRLNDDGDDGKDLSFECILDPLDAEGSANTSVPIHVSNEQQQILTDMFLNGDFVSASSTLVLDQDMRISFEGVFIPSQRATFKFGESANKGTRRHLSRTEGGKPFLVVKVADSEGRKSRDSTDQISDNIFGTYGDQMSLQSQMEACSYSKFGVIAGNGDQHEVSPGVIEVTIDKSLVGNSRWAIREAVKQEVQLLLGHALPGPYAHVMYILEGCYTECGWAAYATRNSWLSVYQGPYYKMVGVLMHEIGHNLNLAHSGGLDGGTYTDKTGMMGNPLYSDDIGAMCFNAAKSWQLGWYDDSTIVINPREGSWRGTVIGVADYGNNPQNYPVVIKVETQTGTDQFITFNRASGINRHNKEADDEVTIVEAGSNGEFYAQSFLQATLRSNEVYTIPKWDGTLDLIVTVQAININAGSSADYAEISVCLGHCIVPTERPSASPSISPTQVPTSVPSKSPSISPTRVPTSVPSRIPLSDYEDFPVHYKQMGVDIDGQESDGFLGHVITLSKDGSRVVVTAPGEDGGKGVTRAFDWESDTEEWVQVGQNIQGIVSNGGLGFSMAMNEAGSRIVLGAPEASNDDGLMRVYELDATNTWQLLGSEIHPVAGSKGQAGVSVSMNAIGDRVAFGAPRTNSYSGRVSVFQLVDGQWLPLGQNVDSDEYFAYSGGCIAMDAEGKRLVVAGKLGNYYKGIVQVYDFDDVSSQWQLITSMNGLDYYDRFGGSVAINEDGSRIVVGSPTSDGQELGVYNAGQFQVFDYDGSSWKVIGQKIIGAAPMDKFGEAVSISGDGTHIAISSPESDDNGNNAGKVEVYKYSEEEQAWVDVGADILGECEGYKFGEGGGAVALDRTGAHLAVGAIRGNYYAGMSRVFAAVAGEGSINNGSNNECV